jgi:hypothetical protein
MAFTDRLHNRGSISTGYDIENSLKFESDNAEYLMAEGRSQGNQQTWTFSIWLKRTEVDNGSVAQYIFSAGSDGKLGIYFRDDASYPDDRIFIYLDEGNSQKWIGQVNQSFRDTAAWYHFVFACDSTDSTPADRTKLYINGVQQTITFNATLNANVSTRIGDSGGKFALGARIATPGYNFNGYMAEAVLVDGSALTPTSFGEYDDDSGIWKPKDVSSLSLGTTGFHMNFDDSSNVGAVQRGNNGGNFDKYNLSAADQATDTPTNNFCTLNPLYNYAYGNTITEGATKIYGAANNWGGGKATFGLTSGKWYWEIKQLANGNTFMGLQTDGEDNISSGNAQSQNTSVVFYTDGTLQYSNGSETTTSAANSIVANSIVGFALDLDSSTQTIKVYLNGSLITAFGSSGTANLSTYNIADKTVFPFVALYDRTVNMNFGGYTVSSISSAETDENGYGTFEYAPPSGYYALCTKNLEEFG